MTTTVALPVARLNEILTPDAARALTLTSATLTGAVVSPAGCAPGVWFAEATDRSLFLVDGPAVDRFVRAQQRGAVIARARRLNVAARAGRLADRAGVLV